MNRNWPFFFIIWQTSLSVSWVSFKPSVKHVMLQLCPADLWKFLNISKGVLFQVYLEIYLSVSLQGESDKTTAWWGKVIKCLLFLNDNNKLSLAAVNIQFVEHCAPHKMFVAWCASPWKPQFGLIPLGWMWRVQKIL